MLYLQREKVQRKRPHNQANHHVYNSHHRELLPVYYLINAVHQKVQQEVSHQQLQQMVRELAWKQDRVHSHADIQNIRNRQHHQPLNILRLGHAANRLIVDIRHLFQLL